MLTKRCSLLEGMRLHPVIAMILPRTVPKGEQLRVGNLIIPSGTIVGTNPYVLHQQKEVYGSDADVFNPNRWLDCTNEKRKQMEGTMLHFGGASRSCPGQNLALIAMSKLLTAIFINFNVELVDNKRVLEGQPFVEEVAFVLKWFHVYARLTDRK